MILPIAIQITPIGEFESQHQYEDDEFVYENRMNKEIAEILAIQRRYSCIDMDTCGDTRKVERLRTKGWGVIIESTKGIEQQKTGVKLSIVDHPSNSSVANLLDVDSCESNPLM